MTGEITEKAIVEALTGDTSKKVFLKFREEVEFIEHFGDQVYTRDYPVRAGRYQVTLQSIVCGKNSPVLWLAVEFEKQSKRCVGLAIGFLVAEHNAGRMKIDIEG